MIQAIFFDFNGVIIDDEPIQMKAYQAALQAFEISLTEEQYYAALGMDDRAFVRAAFTQAARVVSEQDQQSIIDRKTELHRELINDELPLFPGVVTFLKATARHYSLGLVSMARLKEITYVLERARLDNLFTTIVSAEEVSNHKPDPECYRRGLAMMNAKRASAGMAQLSAGHCLAIEDAPQGIEAARATGLRTLGVTNTVPEAELRAAGAEVVTRSLADWNVDAVRLLFS